MCFCVYIDLFVCLSIYLSICLSIYLILPYLILSIYLSIQIDWIFEYFITFITIQSHIPNKS